jgi:hypothetical protein
MIAATYLLLLPRPTNLSIMFKVVYNSTSKGLADHQSSSGALLLLLTTKSRKTNSQPNIPTARIPCPSPSISICPRYGISIQARPANTRLQLNRPPPLLSQRTKQPSGGSLVHTRHCAVPIAASPSVQAVRPSDCPGLCSLSPLCTSSASGSATSPIKYLDHETPSPPSSQRLQQARWCGSGVHGSYRTRTYLHGGGGPTHDLRAC